MTNAGTSPGRAPRPWLFLTLVCLLAAALDVSARADAPRLELEPCGFPEPEEDLLCGTFEVLEDRAARAGRTIGLRVVVVPALEPGDERRALFVLAGGPGASAVGWGRAISRNILAGIRRTHDLVLVDQRGSGESGPLDCRLGAPDDLQGLWGDLFPVDAIRRCREELSRKAELGLYGSAHAAADFDAVRRALGYGPVDLYGSSYGSLLGQVILRRHPQAVRTAILKGLASPAARAPLGFARDSQASLDRLLELCDGDEGCRAAYPELRRQLDGLLARLERGPLAVEVPHPDTGDAASLELTYDHFALVLRGMLHDPGWASAIPRLVHHAHSGDFSPFAEAAFTYRRLLDRNLRVGLFLSVFCNETAVRRVSPAAAARAARGSFVRDYWYTQLRSACDEWPRAEVPAGYDRPVRSETPVLLISGGLDPTTPPRSAAEVARGLPRSLHVVVPHASHSFGLMLGCVDRIMTDFVARASVEGLDTSCVEAIMPHPFAPP